MKFRSLVPVLVAGVLAGANSARADVKPHALFTENMVLQQGIKVPVWGTADDGEKVTVRCQNQEVAASPVNGKWMVLLDKLQPGGPFEFSIKGKNSIEFKNVLVGEVWICSGQSNMEWTVGGSAEVAKAAAEAGNPNLRLFTVAKRTLDTPAADLAKGEWKLSTVDNIKGFSAVGYFFGRDLQKARNVPVGLIHTSWGGTVAEAWTSKAVLEGNPELKSLLPDPEGDQAKYLKAKERYEAELVKHKEAVAKAKADGTPPPKNAPRPPSDPAHNPNLGAHLYNGMIAPLIPYGIAGATWYQGESNAGRAKQYQTLLPAMIKNWRDDWKQGDFPFLIVQLAPYMKISKEPQESQWAELREAQLLTALHTPKVGLAVITDVGDEKDVHPKQKEPVGARLALAARAIGYGEKIEYAGPLYEALKVDGDKAIVSFTHADSGLEAKGGELTGFTVAGADKKFYNATATIVDKTVVVSSPDVKQPVAVRFGWANFPVVNLWNKDNLPATPFRTDGPLGERAK